MEKSDWCQVNSCTTKNYIVLFISIVTKINTRNFPVIMPFLRHIVEQRIETLYCSLLISLKIKVATHNIRYSFLCINVLPWCLKCCDFINLDKITTFTVSTIEVLQGAHLSLNGFPHQRFSQDSFAFSAILRVNGIGHSVAKAIVTIAI